MLPACKICCLDLLITFSLLLKYAIIPTICSNVHLFYEWSEIFVQKLIKYCRTLSSAFLKIFCFFGSSMFGYSCLDMCLLVIGCDKLFWSRHVELEICISLSAVKLGHVKGYSWAKSDL